MIDFAKKHSSKAGWSATLLAIVGLAFQAWHQHDELITSKSSNAQLWVRIHEQDEEIASLKAELNYFEGTLHIQYHGIVDKRPTVKPKQ